MNSKRVRIIIAFIAFILVLLMGFIMYKVKNLQSNLNQNKKYTLQLSEMINNELQSKLNAGYIQSIAEKELNQVFDDEFIWKLIDNIKVEKEEERNRLYGIIKKNLDQYIKEYKNSDKLKDSVVVESDSLTKAIADALKEIDINNKTQYSIEDKEKTNQMIEELVKQKIKNDGVSEKHLTKLRKSVVKNINFDDIRKQIIKNITNNTDIKKDIEKKTIQSISKQLDEEGKTLLDHKIKEMISIKGEDYFTQEEINNLINLVYSNVQSILNEEINKIYSSMSEYRNELDHLKISIEELNQLIQNNKVDSETKNEEILFSLNNINVDITKIKELTKELGYSVSGIYNDINIINKNIIAINERIDKNDKELQATVNDIFLNLTETKNEIKQLDIKIAQDIENINNLINTVKESGSNDLSETKIQLQELINTLRQDLTLLGNSTSDADKVIHEHLSLAEEALAYLDDDLDTAMIGINRLQNYMVNVKEYCGELDHNIGVLLDSKVPGNTVVEKFDNLNSKVVKNFDSLNHKVIENFDSLNHSIVEKFENLNNRLGSAKDELNNIIGELNHSTVEGSTIIEKIDHLNQSLDTATKELKEIIGDLNNSKVDGSTIVEKIDNLSQSLNIATTEMKNMIGDFHDSKVNGTTIIIKINHLKNDLDQTKEELNGILGDLEKSSVPGNTVAEKFDNLNRSLNNVNTTINDQLGKEPLNVGENGEKQETIKSALNYLFGYILDLKNSLTNAIDAIKTKNTEQDNEIQNIKSKDSKQDTDIQNIKSKDSKQDTDIQDIKSKDAQQDTEINHLKTTVADGKSKVADAITNKGVSTNPLDTFQRMADNINILATNQYNSGKEQGKNEGIAIGKEQGKNEGIAIGKEQGKNEGIEIGREQGINQFMTAYRVLEYLPENEYPVDTFSYSSYTGSYYQLCFESDKNLSYGSKHETYRTYLCYNYLNQSVFSSQTTNSYNTSAAPEYEIYGEIWCKTCNKLISDLKEGKSGRAMYGSTSLGSYIGQFVLDEFFYGMGNQPEDKKWNENHTFVFRPSKHVKYGILGLKNFYF